MSQALYLRAALAIGTNSIAPITVAACCSVSRHRACYKSSDLYDVAKLHDEIVPCTLLILDEK